MSALDNLSLAASAADELQQADGAIENERICRAIEGPDDVSLMVVNELPLAEAALHYARHGIRVFPLVPRGKVAFRGTHGCKDATTDEERIAQWWSQTPDANIGIATGEGTGFLVLDVDGEEGIASLKRLMPENVELPETAMSQTGKGFHYLFRDNGKYRNSTSGIAPKLDIRTDGGHIVAPPSVHPSGHRYRWLRDSIIADPPEWLSKAILQKTRQPQRSQSAPLPEGDTISEGSRNAALASFAGTLRKRGIEAEELFEHLDTFNQHRCDPPLFEREVRAIARSIAKYPAGVQKFALTDYGNAQRFVVLHGEDIRYTSRAGQWFYWCGTHWQQSHRDEIMRKVFEVPAAIHLEVDYAADNDERDGILKHAVRSQNRPKLEAVLELAKPLLSKDEGDFDKNPMLVSVRNGQINLVTGERLPHRREDFITKHIDIEHDEAATCPRFNEFLDEVTCGDKMLALFLQRLCGYCLTGSTVEQSLYIFHGHGANGKSTLIELLQAIMGPYAAKTPMTTFLNTKGEKATNDLARLRGTRLVSAVEVGRGDRLNEPLLKELTGGDSITARFLFKEYFQYKPQFKIVMSVNDLPRIEAGDEAINRRLCVIPFNATFSPDRCDKHLPDKLREEFPGILRWLVDGAVEWQRHGLDKPQAIAQATASYISTNDTLGEFIKECCISSNGHISAKVFFHTYSKWLKETHGLDTTKTAVGRLMTKKGYGSKVRSKERVYEGMTYDPGKL